MTRFRSKAYVVLLALIFSCAKNTDPIKKSATNTQRVVSLAPSTTEALFALGLGDRVVGVSRYCDYPADVHNIPKVGGFTDPSLEAILALRPSLVVGARSPSNRGVVRQLLDHGIEVYFPQVHGIQDIHTVLTGLAEHVGVTQRGAELVASINRDLKNIAQQYALLDKPRVLLIYGLKPISAAGPGSFADDMIQAAHGRNVVKEGTEYPTLGFEQVLSLAPDVIVLAVAQHMPKTAQTNLGWDAYTSIPAVRNHRVITINDDRLLRPGPRIAEAVRVLAQVIHQHAP